MSFTSYSIVIKDENSNTLFDGFFQIDSTTSLVIGFYSNNNPNTNILIPTGSIGNLNTSYNYENFNAYIYSINNDPFNNIVYDNVYKDRWLQFDYHGVILSSFPGYSNNQIYSLSSIEMGFEKTSTHGYLALISYSGNVTSINVSFNIQLYVPPTPQTPTNGIYPYLNMQPDSLSKYCQNAYCNNQIIYQKDKRFNTSGNETQISNAMRYSQLVNKRSASLVNNLTGGVSLYNTSSQSIPQQFSSLFKTNYK